MEKQIIEVKVFSKISNKRPFKFLDIKDIIQDNDRIISGWEEAYHTENEGMNAHWYMQVYRERLETDEEFEKRKADDKDFKLRNKRSQYKNYLKLKEIFHAGWNLEWGEYIPTSDLK